VRCIGSASADAQEKDPAIVVSQLRETGYQPVDRWFVNFCEDVGRFFQIDGCERHNIAPQRNRIPVFTGAVTSVTMTIQ
jgi:hypothetical protein